MIATGIRMATLEIGAVRVAGTTWEMSMRTVRLTCSLPRLKTVEGESDEVVARTPVDMRLRCIQQAPRRRTSCASTTFSLAAGALPVVIGGDANALRAGMDHALLAIDGNGGGFDDAQTGPESWPRSSMRCRH